MARSQTDGYIYIVQAVRRLMCTKEMALCREGINEAQEAVPVAPNTGMLVPKP